MSSRQEIDQVFAALIKAFQHKFTPQKYPGLNRKPELRIVQDLKNAARQESSDCAKLYLRWLFQDNPEHVAELLVAGSLRTQSQPKPSTIADLSRRGAQARRVRTLSRDYSPLQDSRYICGTQADRNPLVQHPWPQECRHYLR